MFQSRVVDMTLQKHNFLYFTALPPTIDKFSIRAEPFHPSLVRPTATPRPRSDHLLHVPSAIHPSFQPLLNHEPTAPQPFPIQPTTTLQPQHNHPSCRIHERFRHNHPTSTILESTTLSCTALARPSTVLSKSGRFALASQSHDMVQYIPAMAKAKVTGRRRGLR